MHYIKRNTKFSILSFLSPEIILTLINYIQFLTKTKIHFTDRKQEDISLALFNFIFPYERRAGIYR